MNMINLEDATYSSAYNILCAPVNAGNLREGLYPTFCRIPGHGKTKEHAHFEPEVFYIIDGQGEISFGGQKRPVKSGDLIHIPPHTFHELQNLHDRELTFLSVYSEDYSLPALPPKTLITAAPPTPNGPLHLGHISGPYLASDVLRRYLKLKGGEVAMETGTDDHQNYVEARAKSLGLETATFRNDMRTRIAAGLANFDIQFDRFIEPATDDAYKARLASFVERARAGGAIEQETMNLPYCHSCEVHLVDALITGLCPQCGEGSRGGCEACGLVVMPQELKKQQCSQCQAPAGKKATSVHTFNLSSHLSPILPDLEKLALGKSVEKLLRLVRTKDEVKVLALHGETVHVWFEMASMYEEFATSKSFWAHSFGFDNAFHYMLFIPALLRKMNPETKLPDAVLINEFLHLGGEKFSTSRNHAIWADEVADAGTLRLYLAHERPSGTSSNFSLENFKHFSAELNQKLHELRTLIPGLPRGTSELSAIIECNRLTKEFERHYGPGGFDLRKASRTSLAFLDSILRSPLSGPSLRLKIHAFAVTLSPLMPKESEALLQLMGEERAHWPSDWGNVA